MTREVTAYERELGERLGVEHVVAVSSGTAALQTALDAVSMGPGDTTRLRRFVTDHGLAVVADSCQALGSTIDGAQVGIEAALDASPHTS